MTFPRRPPERRRCLAPRRRAGRCQNYADTCPIVEHRIGSAGATNAADYSADNTEHAMRSSGSLVRPAADVGRRLHDDRGLFDAVVSRASAHYGLADSMIIADYWLIRTLHAWIQAVGNGYVQRRHPDPNLSEVENRAGKFVFAGGTSLSAAWGIADRWSEDIDMVLSRSPLATPKQLRQACEQAFRATANGADSHHTVTDKSDAHSFASFLRDTKTVARVDVAFKHLAAPQIMTQRETAMSLIGRVVDDDLLDDCPELGGFEVETLGPCSVAMDKLLAQTQTSESGDLEHIAERARDVYDLACIAREQHRFEGHIGRDSSALLRIAEDWHPDGIRRPPDGFASLRAYDQSTDEHEALAAGYDQVLDNMVWGDKIPLNEAIHLAVSLDPGPREPPRTLAYDPRVAYPRH